MERRRILQILAAGATSFWAKQLPASALLAPAAQERPQPEPLLPLFPLELVLFPRTNLPLHIFEERYKEMIHDCLENHWEFGILLVQEKSVEQIGCTASISQVLRRYPDGRMDILVRGRRRFEIADLNQDKSYLRGKPQFFEDDETNPPTEALRQEAIQLYSRLVTLADSEDPSRKDRSPTFSDQLLSFQLMTGLPASPVWRQALLELRSERERLERVMGYLQHLIEYLEHRGDPDKGAPTGTA